MQVLRSLPFVASGASNMAPISCEHCESGVDKSLAKQSKFQVSAYKFTRIVQESVSTIKHLLHLQRHTPSVRLTFLTKGAKQANEII